MTNAATLRFSIILLHWFPSLSLVDHMAVFICFWFTCSLHFQSGWQKKSNFFGNYTVLFGLFCNLNCYCYCIMLQIIFWVMRNFKPGQSIADILLVLMFLRCPTLVLMFLHGFGLWVHFICCLHCFIFLYYVSRFICFIFLYYVSRFIASVKLAMIVYFCDFLLIITSHKSSFTVHGEVSTCLVLQWSLCILQNFRQLEVSSAVLYMMSSAIYFVLLGILPLLSVEYGYGYVQMRGGECRHTQNGVLLKKRRSLSSSVGASCHGKAKSFIKMGFRCYAAIFRILVLHSALQILFINLMPCCP
jgi:hypothetical protein